MNLDNQISTAENAYEGYMSRWLNLTDYDYDEANNFDNRVREIYEKKHNFLVDEIGINEYVINAASPSFFPDCPLVGYLLQEFFQFALIDDEYNLIVRLDHPVSTFEDLDYIAISYHNALEWLSIWKAERAAYSAYISALRKWEALNQEMINLRPKRA